MKHTLALIGVFLTLGSCGAGTWCVARPPLAPFLVPGATAIQIAEVGVWERQITYHAPGPPYAWYFTVARNLESNGWTPSERWRPDGLHTTYNPVIPLWFRRSYFGCLREQALLDPDHRNPNVARIQLRRWVAIPHPKELTRVIDKLLGDR